MNSSKFLCVVSFILLSGISFDSLAYIQGEMRAKGGTHNYIVDMGITELPSNIPGATVTKNFKLGEQYMGIYYCTSPIYQTRTKYKGGSNLQLSDTSGYYVLNEYFDVQIKYYVWGQGNVTLPFENVPNLTSETQRCTPPSSLSPGAISGGSGQVIFRLKKPIVNGLMISSSGIADMFGRLDTNGETGFGNEPIAHLTIGNAIFTARDKCTINNGNPIYIEFDTIPNTSKQLNGVNYQKDMLVPIECTGGGFDGNSSVQFAIQPASGVSAFNSDYLATSGTVDRSNLAIAIKDRAGNIVTPNHFYTVPSVSNTNGYKGTWSLLAAPVANQGSTIPEGDFEASATIVARFQ
ncbi:fimbrial protein [Enterobacter cancerogenus]